MHTKPVLAAGAAALSLVAAACGGGSSSGGQATTSPGTTTRTATAMRAPVTAAATPPPQTEASPPGDIPDNQAFVRVAPAGLGYSVEVPEGWARRRSGGAFVFTDKLNTVRLESKPVQGALTAAAVRRADIPALSRAATRFTLGDVSVVTRVPGKAVLVTYTADSPRDPVTGKVFADDFERYAFAHAGREAILTLSGPKGSDNVDPWRRITDSLQWHG